MIGAMSHLALALTAIVTAATAVPMQACPDYSSYSQTKHMPYSSGRYQLSSMRPVSRCRTFQAPKVDNLITSYKNIITDPDLYALFANTFPNTLDTAVKFKGFASNNTEEELTFLITGDLDALYLRDAANQLQSYLSLLSANSAQNSLASLYRGLINLQARYLLMDPYCNAYQPPPESGLSPTVNGAASDDTVTPAYDNQTVYECKYELDSITAFLEVSSDYYNKTGDASFFGKYNWVSAVKNVMMVANAMMTPTYASDGSVNVSPYTFTRLTSSGTETLANSGIGNPVQSGTGLIRSAFRPSDDATIFQLFIPANMMFSAKLASAAAIMRQLPGQSALATQMSNLASSVRLAISQHGIVQDPKYGSIYAYEVDGYGSVNSMDDANIPSLLSAPVFGYLDVSDTVYQNTRKKILSADNPYFMRGPVINSVGGPHVGPGYAWPMASIVRILTSNNDTEIYGTLKELVSSTDGLGLMHESINSFDQTKWTRQWFSWANGLFGQMIVDLASRKPQILKMSFQ